MFIVNITKKKIAFASICIGIILCSVAVVKNNSYKNVMETRANVATQKVVIVDAGHGSPDEGAESANGVTEAKLNLEIALKLKDILEANGVKVLLTRSDENSISDVDKKTIREKKINI